MEEVANNKGKIYKALSSLQAELKPIQRTAEVNAGTYKFKYAPLDEIMTALYPLLGKNELAIRHELTANGVEAVLMHSSGEELRSGAIRVATTGDMKAIGGQITYARRYSVTMLMGIASDEDTDAGDLKVPDQKYTARDAAQNMDVTEQLELLSKCTDLAMLKQTWVSFTPAQRENVELLNKKNAVKDALEEAGIEPVINREVEEDTEVPPDYQEEVVETVKESKKD